MTQNIRCHLWMAPELKVTPFLLQKKFFQPMWLDLTVSSKHCDAVCVMNNPDHAARFLDVM